MKLKPGEYKFGKVAYLNGIMEHFRKPLNKNMEEITLKFAPNKAYYLGNYSGNVYTTSSSGVRTIYWKLTGLKDYYDATTQDFKKRYAHFADIPTVNMLEKFKKQLLSEIVDNITKLASLVKQKKFAQAYEMAEDMASNNNALAMNLLGYMYNKGLHVEKSTLQAARWFKKAADLGHSDSMMNLGILILKNNPNKSKDPEQKDIEKEFGNWRNALKWIIKSATRANSRAMMYLCRIGVGNKASSTLRIESTAWCGIAKDLLPEKKTALRQTAAKYYASAKTTLSAKDFAKAKQREADYRARINAARHSK